MHPPKNAALQAPEPPSDELTFVLDSVLGRLRAQMRPEQFDTWYRAFGVGELSQDELEFTAPSGFVRDWLNRNYYDRIQGALDTVLDAMGWPRRRVRIILGRSVLGEVPATGGAEPIPIHGALRSGDARRDQDGSAQQLVSSAVEQLVDPATSCGVEDLPKARLVSAPSDRITAPVRLNRDYTFDHYVVGPSNQLAHAAAEAVGANPGKGYNPLFVHGNVGMGKTHLLQSICHAVGKRSPASRVLYLGCEEFTNRFISAIQNSGLAKFRDHYRSADVLVIDDVQFLVGKEKTQEELFHNFNALYDNGKQIVFSSDRSPAEIPGIEERLVSRFKWGLVTDVQPPCLETRFAIVKRKGLLRGADLDDEVAALIAERITTNIREVEGAVIRVIGVAAVTQRPITLALAEEALRGISGAVRTRQITVPDIISLVTNEFSITPRDLTGRCRTSRVSLPRQIGMYLSRKFTDLSLEEIGHQFSRDHTTVMYSVSRIKERSTTDKSFRELLARLASRLESGNLDRPARKD
ncbi:MAG: chromosomal replication initiator protein DnaA [Planctomycetes bacterium]|nr:chromosomal replication initiator protein DnaA [Planctomycetota bacterium]MCB9870263.1 chromosomal replication initiator protein DnaA [Planctomycetota bacterium]MCB9888157.1 chromosomal replication initiator protein DnaA [Planctomycetota bacterium]